MIFDYFCSKNTKMARQQNKHKVIIIGAGISGIKSSIDLTSNGVENIILEARDRIGGRLHSITTDSGLKLDLGASWFHDCLDNPLFKKSIKNGNVNYYFDNGRFEYYNNELGLLDDNLKLKPVVEEMEAYLEHVCGAESSDNDISVREAAMRYMLDKKETLTDDQIKYAPQLLRYFEMWIGSSWNMLSARLIAGDSHLGRDAMVTNGYKTVYNNELEELIKLSKAKSSDELIESGKIMLEKTVFKIEFNDQRKEICVNVKNSLGNIEKYYCEYLICSTPLSVLQLTDKREIGAIEWSPALPRSITSKLEKVTYSQLGKVFLEFDEVFWPTDVDRFFCIPEFDKVVTDAIKSNNTNLKFPKHRKDSEIHGEPQDWTYPILFLNLYRGTGKPVILALTSSPLTNYVESNPSVDKIWPVFKSALAKVSKINPGQAPTPINSYVSNWTNDPFARGSYAGCAVGDELNECITEMIEAKGIFDGKGRVRFVGEGLIVRGNGCAHGAWLAAERETKKVLALINKSKL